MVQDYTHIKCIVFHSLYILYVVVVVYPLLYAACLNLLQTEGVRTHPIEICRPIQFELCHSKP